MATNFGTKNCYNWLCLNDSDKAIGYGGKFEWSANKMQIYCQYPATKGCCHGNHFLAFNVL